jgi:hypothetical protein
MAKPMRILFFQEAVCIRNWKMANALQSKGYKVDLMYVRGELSDTYKGLDEGIYEKVMKMEGLASLWDLLERPQYDIIHFHNEPDIWSGGSFGKMPYHT